MDYREDYQTKTDKRDQKRNKDRHSPIGTPMSKIRVASDIEVQTHINKIKKKKDRKKGRMKKQEQYLEYNND